MEQPIDYNINLDVKFAPKERIDIDELVRECTDQWFNQTLTQVNDSVVRLGIVHGEFHWHKHDNDDEFFYVVSGRLNIELQDRTIELGPNQGVTIPKGEMHKPVAPERTVILMVETSAVQPTGDVDAELQH